MWGLLRGILGAQAMGQVLGLRAKFEGCFWLARRFSTGSFQIFTRSLRVLKENT